MHIFLRHLDCQHDQNLPKNVADNLPTCFVIVHLIDSLHFNFCINVKGRADVSFCYQIVTDVYQLNITITFILLVIFQDKHLINFSLNYPNIIFYRNCV